MARQKLINKLFPKIGAPKIAGPTKLTKKFARPKKPPRLLQSGLCLSWLFWCQWCRVVCSQCSFNSSTLVFASQTALTTLKPLTFHSSAHQTAKMLFFTNSVYIWVARAQALPNRGRVGSLPRSSGPAQSAASAAGSSAGGSLAQSAACSRDCSVAGEGRVSVRGRRVVAIPLGQNPDRGRRVVAIPLWWRAACCRPQS